MWHFGFWCVAWACAALVVPGTPPAAPRGLPPLVVPDGIGVNIHFTDAQPGEMRMLAEAGLRWVRMDFAWVSTERERGRYDFSAYERLLRDLDAHGMRALFILDYSNPLYDDNLSPHSEEGRAAFARWAAAAARHFRGRGVIWEMYNEPNIGFWRPEPKVADYVKLALAVGEAIRREAPGEVYVGPATSGIDLAFLEACFRAGLLRYWDAVTVHPYRQSDPETAAREYGQLRHLIDRYAPRGKRVAILSGEWGYSAAWSGYDEEIQGRMLPRQWLTNLLNDVPLSIWYDWHDDGPDPREPEHHFGTVRHPYHEGADPVYEPKPAYLAARTLCKELEGYRCSRRLSVGSPEDYVLLFTRGESVRIAAWTTAREARAVTLPGLRGGAVVVSHTGAERKRVRGGPSGLRIALSQAPQYVLPDSAPEVLRIAAASDRLPASVVVTYRPIHRATLVIRNPLPRSVRVRASSAGWRTLPPGGTARLTFAVPLLRDGKERLLEARVQVEGEGVWSERCAITVADPLRITCLPPVAGRARVVLEKHGGAPVNGVALVTLDGTLTRKDVALPPGPARLELSVSQAVRASAGTVSVRVVDGANRLLAETPTVRFVPVTGLDRALRVEPDGDPKVGSAQTARLEVPPGGPPSPGMPCVRVDYRFDGGWKFLRLGWPPGETPAIEGRPKAMGVWVHGDGTGDLARMRFVDASGQTFQPDGEPISWRGWRFVTFPMDGTRSGRWGGPNDGVVRLPIRWDTLFLLDSPGGRRTQGTVYLSGPVLLYE